MLALYQPDGGLVDAAMGNAVHIQLARSHGATVIENCKVTRIEPETAGTALVYILKYIHIYTHKPPYKHTYIHIHTNTRSYIHTNTHTHVCIYM